MPTAFGTLVFGLLLGVRHAFEPDHLAAVSSLVTVRRHAGAGAMLGAVWGVGHSVSLLLVGLSLAALRMQLSPRLAAVFELSVALMLIALGTRSVVRSLHTDRRALHDTQQARPGTWALARWPLVIGLVHGLAGSGALTALAMSSLPTLRAQLVYIGLFGLGSVLSMAAITAVVSWPIYRVTEQRYFARALLGVTGAFSMALGLSIAAPILHQMGVAAMRVDRFWDPSPPRAKPSRGFAFKDNAMSTSFCKKE